MHINEVRELKSELDGKLSDLIVEFENRTGLEISSIVIKREILADEPTIGVEAFVII